ncbi:hypothetical protein CYMTET_27909 [Cymbomonas tetramitiformis]|uniref:Uncharacterized protein n=1 Tax=Cymbomonas tetramitiformis TaxID=36881 RepID=A0AAE0FPG0_9CHLO|nr:hypothetical protein CYMTET_27909 [Cymbomonas tetramitiformis]
MSKKHQKSTGWGADAVGVPLLLVSSVGTTLPGTDRVYRSHIPDEECEGMLKIVKKTVIQPVVVAFWRLIFHVIDGHNRQRTGTVAMHDVWRTQSWEHRDFGELLMIIIVNAENAWKFFDLVGKQITADFQAGQHVNPRRQFLHNLCAELLDNCWLTASDTFVSSEIIPDEAPATSVSGRSSHGSRHSESQPSKEHVPVTVDGQASMESATVAMLLQKVCIPQPLPKGVQGKCGVPTCATLLKSKDGEHYYRPYKTAVKCGRCHLTQVDGVERPAYVCSPLSGRTCWFEHIAYCEAHGHAHPVGLMKSKEPRKTEVYKGLSAVQRDIASGAAIVSAQKEQTLPAKRRVGRPSGAKSKRARKSAPANDVVEIEDAAEILLSLPAPSDV